MNRKGEVTTTPKIKIPVRLTSEQFNYSVIADRGFASGAVAFIRYEQHTLIAILLASLLLAFLFRNYLRYRQTIEYQLRKAIELKQLKPYIQPMRTAPLSAARCWYAGNIPNRDLLRRINLSPLRNRPV